MEIIFSEKEAMEERGKGETKGRVMRGRKKRVVANEMRQGNENGARARER